MSNGLSKAEVESRLVTIASEVKEHLSQIGGRYFKAGLLLIEAKRLCGSVKVFEAWLASSLQISVASAYRWMQTAQSLASFQLDRYPELLEVADTADMVQVSMPASLRRRLENRVKVYQTAAKEAAEAQKDLDREKGKLAKVEAEAKAANDRLETAKQAAAKKLSPVKVEADGQASKLADQKERVSEAAGKVSSIMAAAREKVQLAKAKVREQGQAVAQAASRAAAAEAEKQVAKASVKETADKGKADKASKANDTKALQSAKDWDAFSKATIQTVINRALDMFPDRKQAAEKIGQLADALLAATRVVETGGTLKAA